MWCVTSEDSVRYPSIWGTLTIPLWSPDDFPIAAALRWPATTNLNLTHWWPKSRRPSMRKWKSRLMAADWFSSGKWTRKWTVTKWRNCPNSHAENISMISRWTKRWFWTMKTTDVSLWSSTGMKSSLLGISWSSSAGWRTEFTNSTWMKFDMILASSFLPWTMFLGWNTGAYFFLTIFNQWNHSKLLSFQSPHCKQLPETHFIPLGGGGENLGKTISFRSPCTFQIHWIWWRLFHHLQHCQSERGVDLEQQHHCFFCSCFIHFTHASVYKIRKRNVIFENRESLILNWNKLSDILFCFLKNAWYISHS